MVKRVTGRRLQQAENITWLVKATAENDILAFFFRFLYFYAFGFSYVQKCRGFHDYHCRQLQRRRWQDDDYFCIFMRLDFHTCKNAEELS